MNTIAPLVILILDVSPSKAVGNNDKKHWIGVTVALGSTDPGQALFMDGSPFVSNSLFSLYLAYGNTECTHMYYYAGVLYQSTFQQTCASQFPYMCQWEPRPPLAPVPPGSIPWASSCLLYTSDAADE